MKKFIKKIFLNGVMRFLVELVRNLIVVLTTPYKIFVNNLNQKFFEIVPGASQNSSISNNTISHARNMPSARELETSINGLNKTREKFNLTMIKTLHRKYFNLKTNNSHDSARRKKEQLKLKWVFFFFFLVIIYVSLNNYLIIFIYMSPGKDKSITTIRSTSIDLESSIFSYFIYWASAKKPSPASIRDSLYPGNSSTPVQALIDPLDIELGNFKYILNNEKVMLLDESYFTDSTFSKIPDQKRRQCLLPKLNPYDRSIMQFIKKETPLRCNPKQNWIYVKDGAIHISKSASNKHGIILCAYIPLYRGHNDFSVFEGNRIFPIMDNFPLITDFFKIDCRSKDGGIYSNIHSGIAYESTLQFRHAWNPLPKKALGFNVLMFGFDSVSRMSWIRMLPKSYAYMIQQGFIVLKGYNIVGDGTPQALLPILTGHKETELPESRRGFPNASYVDVFPWIWKKFKKAGYVTQWAEDMQSIGTFQLRMLGFRHQPVDHYMRVFYLEAERYYSRFRHLCLGSISRHNNMINWVKEFFLTYNKTKPKFSFIFHSEASHNYNNPLSLLDDDLLEFLEYLKSSGIMDNTILLFMSDHGVRVSDLRQYSQGKLEERLPFFSIRMPDKFQVQHPEAMRMLRLNSRKLTTPFDIHETLLSILNFSSDIERTKKTPDNGRLPRGMSLFEHIPSHRSCEDAQIEAHWCSCLNWINIDFNKLGEPKQKQKAHVNDLSSVYSKFSIKLATKAVEFINSLMDDELKKYCRQLNLISIERVSHLNVNRQLLEFKKSKDIHGREAVFEKFDENTVSMLEKLLKQGGLGVLNGSNIDDKAGSRMDSYVNSEINFQIVLTTAPNNASYELSFKYNVYDGLFRFNKNEISRINSYNNTANCILDKRPDLRQFCYCKPNL